MRPEVSIIVPVYNLEREVATCLLSLILQKFKDFEVIVIDDGSSDNSLSTCLELAKKDNRIRVFHTENRGLSAARNFGIKKARGSYLAFIDGDDWVDPEFLKTLYSSIKQAGSEVAVTGYSEVNGENITLFPAPTKIVSGREATIQLLTKQENLDILIWNKLYKKSLFREVRFPEGKNHEDNFTTFQLLSKAKKVSYISSTVYNYVKRENSITGSEKTLERLNAKLESAKEAKRIFKKDARDSKLYLAARYSELLAFLQFVDFSIKGEIPKKYFNTFRKKILRSKRTFLRNPFIDFKRKNYIRLLSSSNGFLYFIFRKII